MAFPQGATGLERSSSERVEEHMQQQVTGFVSSLAPRLLRRWHRLCGTVSVILLARQHLAWKLPAEIARRGVTVMAVRGRRSGAEGRIKARGRQAKACAERSAEVRVRHADRDRREKGLEEATGARATRGTKVDAGGLR